VPDQKRVPLPTGIMGPTRVRQRGEGGIEVTPPPSIWERLTTPLIKKPAQPGASVLSALSSPLDILLALASFGGSTQLQAIRKVLGTGGRAIESRLLKKLVERAAKAKKPTRDPWDHSGKTFQQLEDEGEDYLWRMMEGGEEVIPPPIARSSRPVPTRPREPSLEDAFKELRKLREADPDYLPEGREFIEQLTRQPRRYPKIDPNIVDDASRALDKWISLDPGPDSPGWSGRFGQALRRMNETRFPELKLGPRGR